MFFIVILLCKRFLRFSVLKEMKIKDKAQVQYYNVEKAFIPELVISGYMLLFISVLPIFFLYWVTYLMSCVFIITGCLLAFSTSGIALDFKNETLFHYTAYFNIFKAGPRFDLKKYEYITVVINDEGFHSNDMSIKTHFHYKKNYDVCVVDAAESNRQLIVTYSHASKAINFAKELAEVTGKKYISHYVVKNWEV